MLILIKFQWIYVLCDGLFAFEEEKNDNIPTQNGCIDS